METNQDRIERIKMTMCTNPKNIKAMDLVWLIETLEKLLAGEKNGALHT